MTTQTYRLKISRVNNLKLKTVARFPALVRVENFLTLTSENGVYTFGVDYSKLSPGPISDASTAYISIEDKTSGIFREVSLASLLTSGLDADLHAIAALTSNGILSRTADNTWALRTLTGTANEITVTNGSGVSGNPTVSLPAALTFTGKTVTGGTYQSPTISTPTGIVKGDVGLGNVDNTSDATKNAASATLTNKTISGASNTLTVREADLSTSDVTTADVSTTKHGFAPKLPNDSTKFLNGVGVYSTPAGSGVSVSGTPTANQMAQWTNSTTIQGANIASVLSAGIGISISGTTTATIAVNHSTLSNSLGSGRPQQYVKLFRWPWCCSRVDGYLVCFWYRDARGFRRRRKFLLQALGWNDGCRFRSHDYFKHGFRHYRCIVRHLQQPRWEHPD